MPYLLTLVLFILAAPASAQPHPNVHVVDCNPTGPATPPSGSVCADGARATQPPADRAQDPAMEAVTRLYAHVARGDVGAIAAALDDHVMWVGPDGRLVGQGGVAARIATLPPAATLTADASGRILATDASGTTTAWRLLDRRVVSVEHRASAPPAGDRR